MRRSASRACPLPLQFPWFELQSLLGRTACGLSMTTRCWPSSSAPASCRVSACPETGVDFPQLIRSASLLCFCMCFSVSSRHWLTASVLAQVFRPYMCSTRCARWCLRCRPRAHQAALHPQPRRAGGLCPRVPLPLQHRLHRGGQAGELAGSCGWLWTLCLSDDARRFSARSRKGIEDDDALCASLCHHSYACVGR